jgi:hypothetical protein
MLVRMQSSHRLFGIPLYDIAIGPDPARGEAKGRAKGIIAVGDVASGLVAVGGCRWRHCPRWGLGRNRQRRRLLLRIVGSGWRGRRSGSLGRAGRWAMG